MGKIRVAVDNALPGDQPAGRDIPKGEDAALYPAEVAYLTGQSTRTLDALRLTGGGIRFFKLGRAVRYKRGDVDAWLADRVRTNTTDPGPPVAERRSPATASEG